MLILTLAYLLQHPFDYATYEGQSHLLQDLDRADAVAIVRLDASRQVRQQDGASYNPVIVLDAVGCKKSDKVTMVAPRWGWKQLKLVASQRYLMVAIRPKQGVLAFPVGLRKVRTSSPDDLGVDLVLPVSVDKVDRSGSLGETVISSLASSMKKSGDPEFFTLVDYLKTLQLTPRPPSTIDALLPQNDRTRPVLAVSAELPLRRKCEALSVLVNWRVDGAALAFLDALLQFASTSQAEAQLREHNFLPQSIEEVISRKGPNARSEGAVRSGRYITAAGRVKSRTLYLYLLEQPFWPPSPDLLATYAGFLNDPDRVLKCAIATKLADWNYELSHKPHYGTVNGKFGVVDLDQSVDYWRRRYGVQPPP